MLGAPRWIRSPLKTGPILTRIRGHCGTVSVLTGGPARQPRFLDVFGPGRGLHKNTVPPDKTEGLWQACQMAYAGLVIWIKFDQKTSKNILSQRGVNAW